MRFRAIVGMIGLGVGALVVPAAVHAGGIGTTIDGQDATIGRIAPGGQLDVHVLGRGGVPATGVAAVELNITATEGTTSSFLSVWPTGQPRPTSSTVNFSAGQTVANTTVVGVGDSGQVSLFNYTGSVHVVVDVIGWTPVDGPVHTLPPARLSDTRAGYPTVDGQADGTGPFTTGEIRSVQIAGRGGVPATGTVAIVANVTVTNPTAPGYLALTAAGRTRSTNSLASNINFIPGQTVANMAIIPLGADGHIDVYNYAGNTDVVIDVLGYTNAAAANFTPQRLMDTRPGQPTNDGKESGGGPLGPRVTRNLPVAGRGGIPADAAAVALNITATDTTSASYLTVWPAGAAHPSTSNLNFTAGDTVANMTAVALGTDGQVSIANYAGTTDLVVDVYGWFAADGSFNGLEPARLVDTRPVPTAPAPTPGPNDCTWRADVQDQQGTGGQLFTWLHLTNTADHACAAPHINGATAHTNNGRTVLGLEQSGFGNPPTGLIAAGAPVLVIVSGPTNSDQCGLSLDPDNTLTIDIGTTIDIALPRQPDGACGILSYWQARPSGDF